MCDNGIVISYWCIVSGKRRKSMSLGDGRMERWKGRREGERERRGEEGRNITKTPTERANGPIERMSESTVLPF